MCKGHVRQCSNSEQVLGVGLVGSSEQLSFLSLQMDVGLQSLLVPCGAPLHRDRSSSAPCSTTASWEGEGADGLQVTLAAMSAGDGESLLLSVGARALLEKPLKPSAKEAPVGRRSWWQKSLRLCFLTKWQLSELFWRRWISGQASPGPVLTKPFFLDYLLQQKCGHWCQSARRVFKPRIFPSRNLLTTAWNKTLFFRAGNACIHTCVVKLARKAQVEGEVGDLWSQLPLRVQQSLWTNERFSFGFSSLIFRVIRWVQLSGSCWCSESFPHSPVRGGTFSSYLMTSLVYWPLNKDSVMSVN